MLVNLCVSFVIVLLIVLIVAGLFTWIGFCIKKFDNNLPMALITSFFPAIIFVWFCFFVVLQNGVK